MKRKLPKIPTELALLLLIVVLSSLVLHEVRTITRLKERIEFLEEQMFDVRTGLNPKTLTEESHNAQTTNQD